MKYCLPSPKISRRRRRRRRRSGSKLGYIESKQLLNEVLSAFADNVKEEEEEESIEIGIHQKQTSP